MQIHHLFQGFRHTWVLFLLLFLGSSSKNVHPYYVSVTEIRSDFRQQSLNISCRMFTDDLQDALYKKYQYRTELSKKDGLADAYLQRYIAERLQITVAGKPVTFQLIGYEIEEEATWCYLEATSFPGTGPVQVHNKLLYDYLPEQTHLVHFYRDGERSSYKLVNPEATAYFY